MPPSSCSRRDLLPPPPACSTVRGAIVGVMLTSASPQHQHHPGAPLPSRPRLGFVGGDDGDTGEGSSGTGGSRWSNALAAKSGPVALPRDSPTCVLWCAIALGALVRGFPLDHVGAVYICWHMLLS